MAGKVCPLMSAQNRTDCIAEECMLYVEGTHGGCAISHNTHQTVGRIDTLSAQVQEMQIALISIMNTLGKK